MKHLLLISLLTASAAATTVAQPVTYKNLVLEGGGVRGFAYAGAFEVLDSLQVLKHIERVGGTSAGAIQACLLSVGYTPREILELTAYVKPQAFNDGSWFFGTGMHRLKREFGYYKGEKISEWLHELIARKTGNGDITLGELHRLRVSKGYKDLYITGTDLTYQCLRIFSYEQYPHMRVKDAVRISLSIPLYFKPVLIDDCGEVYEKKVDGVNLHVMVDGGALSNYPLFLFDSSKYVNNVQLPRNVMMENPETLGLMMESPEQIAYNRQHAGHAPMRIKNLKDYVKAVYVTLIDKPSPEAANTGSWKRTITISTLNYSGRVRKLPKKVIDDLLESGREGARRFFGVGQGRPAGMAPSARI